MTNSAGFLVHYNFPNLAEHQKHWGCFKKHRFFGPPAELLSQSGEVEPIDLCVSLLFNILILIILMHLAKHTSTDQHVKIYINDHPRH